ncbi:MAG: ketoacyl-ACP synthase III [Anaerolineae bacterium]|nr:ketoacyl-ACP synthase III [Anaerolineae bacterium]MCB0245863.1 ketoacyl-ACP synthase III [Anaerolineae bacterium]MCB9129434.1 ketoacyl-ACP synthase III [Anaerolineales bacterium]MCB9143522.1 ketoacyl-ACP synthase III [Anaerolineales bacterium]MCO5245603.1 ketoacyl-ACP synthase III [Anaerolineae bacterium]
MSNNPKSAGQSHGTRNGTAGSQRYAQIIGWGMAVPDRIVTNDDLSRIVDTTDEWIRSRTGIAERHIVSDPNETTATLATQAAREALRVTGLPPSALDMVICATSSPEYVFPATASLVQDALGAPHAGAFDLSAACSGFVYALAMARGMIAAGDADYVMVVGAETLSRFVDWTDRGTCILFGDGAGAVLLAASDEPGGILSVVLGSDGSGGDLLIVPAGGSANPATLETVATGQHTMKMDGKAVFRFATQAMADGTRDAVARAGLTLDEIDLVIPHQANSRIIQSSVVKQLKIPAEKVFVNVERYGNTSTASIPIALCEAIEAGRVRPGQNIVFVGFGAGLTWAATAIKWCAPVKKPPYPWWTVAQQEAGLQLAGARSSWRRAARRVYAGTLGPAEAQTFRGRLRASIDAGRETWESHKDKD